MVSGREKLIADVTHFLYQNIEQSIANQLIDSPEYKSGVLKEVINKAKEIANKFSLTLMPTDPAHLKQNIVYVKWNSKNRELEYKILSALGESAKPDVYQGVITTNQLPALETMRAPLELSALQPLCLDILVILSANLHLKLQVDDQGKKSKSDLLNLVLQARDKEFNIWLDRMDEGLAPADEYMLHKLYFKRQFSKIEPPKANETDDDYTQRAALHFAAELKETAKLNKLYRAIFQIYYRLARQLFCLEQFACVHHPERLIKEAEDLRDRLLKENMRAKGCHSEGFQEEYKVFDRAFVNLVKHIKEEPDATEFEPVPRGCRALETLVDLFMAELTKLKQFKLDYDKIRINAQIAAKLGNKTDLQQYLDEARHHIKQINTIQKNLDLSVKQYIMLLQEQIRNIKDAKSEIEKNISTILLKIPNMVYLQLIALYAQSKTDSDNEYDLIAKNAAELFVQSKNQDGIVKNGWSALAAATHKDALLLRTKLEDYTNIYLANLTKVRSAAHQLQAITEWQEKVNALCDNIPNELVQTTETLRIIPAELAARWRKPFEDLVSQTHLNGFMAFMRRNTWKMLLCGALLTAVAAPVAFWLLSCTLIATAIVAAVAFTVGFAIGVGVAKATDNCCKGKVEVDDDVEMQLRGGSSKNSIMSLHEDDDIERICARMRAIAATDLSVVGMKDSHVSSSTTSTNPFDSDYVDAKSEASSYNPFK